jgi:peptidoglycan/xylan/chitin deacetylase (PgdA/CDA1 family)
MTEILVLCYHSVSSAWPASTSVRPEDFERQIADLVGRGYRGTTFSGALTAPESERVLAVTFDDAHRSVLELAAPAMARLGVPGTVFAPTDHATSGRPMAWDGYDVWLGTEHEAELRCMSWAELSGLVAQGWEVGSHTCSHPRLSRLADAEIEAELVESRRTCEERLGVPCRSIAYPYGDYDDRVLRAAREAGYSFGASAPRSPAPSLPLAWPRVAVYHGEGVHRLRLRARSRRLRPSAALRATRPLRRLLPRSGSDG